MPARAWGMDPTAEAAATLGIREVTYRSKLHRAIRRLGAALAADAAYFAVLADRELSGVAASPAVRIAIPEDRARVVSARAQLDDVGHVRHLRRC